jgi:hypothetical protein
MAPISPGVGSTDYLFPRVLLECPEHRIVFEGSSLHHQGFP